MFWNSLIFKIFIFRKYFLLFVSLMISNWFNFWNWYWRYH